MDPADTIATRPLEEIFEEAEADAAPLLIGEHADEQKFGLAGNRADQGEADDGAAPAVDGKGQRTPAIGRIPLSWERVQASPKRSPNALSITRMTASIWSAEPGAI